MMNPTDRATILDQDESEPGEDLWKEAEHAEYDEVSLPRDRPLSVFAPISVEASPAKQGPIFFGINRKMRELQSLVSTIGSSQAPVLIEGETGVGKEVLARELHRHSACIQKRFLKLNCAALPSELVESELFGYERGAFTGAFQRKPGMFELADGGTIFLDEIGDMEFKLQAKLLQVLQDHEFQRLGGREVIRVNVRVIAATHCDLERAIAQDRFREDLYYRLSVINLRVPPLRERKEDILAITEHFMIKHGLEGSRPPEITPALEEILLTYSWPGNIRELENVIRKLLIFKDPAIIMRDLQQKLERATSLGQNRRSWESSGDSGQEPGQATILGQVTRAKHAAEKEAIIAALNSTQWNRKKAALLLKIDYKALLYKMKKLAIEDKMVTLPFRVSATG